MNKLLLLTLAGALAHGAPAAAQSTEKLDAAALAKIRDEGMNRSKVMETAFYLTDVSGPRLANSDGLKRANEWAKSRRPNTACPMPTSKPGVISAAAGTSRNRTWP
ncbi:hypothetical protein ACFQT0_23440 [Hymenobacter humi]|uniref:Peptidase M28 n=1 Tax=Hymenobacter humi TaxID=1411620 RepID=A0ABW2UCC5_9BACT